MKVAICDNNGGKFTTDIREHWEKNHEVKFERGASEWLAQWADVYFVDTWDNNIHYLYKLYHGLHDDMPPNWDNSRKPRIIVRALDWEVWIGLARDQTIIDWVDDVIVIAPHIKDELKKHGDFGNKIHLIRPGVNLNKFPLKSKETDGFQIGMALGDMWWPKNHMGGLDIFTQLYQKDKRWRLHIRGQHEGGNDYWKQMYEHYLDSRGIRDAVTLYPHVDDMNLWFEEIDYLLHPGMKEAFCYAVGEAAAKGIKPIVNNFYGSEKIWPTDWLYNTHQEAISKFMNKGGSIKPNLLYRQFIKEKYNVATMMERFEKLFGI